MRSAIHSTLLAFVVAASVLASGCGYNSIQAKDEVTKAGQWIMLEAGQN